MSNYPYNPYSYNPQQYQEQYRQMQINANEKREFRRHCVLLACGIIFYLVISNAASFVIVFTKLKDVYANSTIFTYAITMILSIASLMGAYFITRAIIDKKHKGFIPLALPENKKHALLLIPVGIATCFAGSYSTGVLNDLLQKIFNVTFEQPDIPNPQTWTEGILFLMSTALVPAIVEEIALRAGMLQAMRKYGDWFAIITSSFVFAILHGNMIQTPFAFIAGLGLGYVFVATGSLWPGIAIHFINNTVSCLVSMGSLLGVSDKTMDVLFVIFLSLLFISGIVCLIVYLCDKNRPKLNKDTSSLSLSQKTVAFIFNVPMILCIIYMGIVTLEYISGS